MPRHSFLLFLLTITCANGTILAAKIFRFIHYKPITYRKEVNILLNNSLNMYEAFLQNDITLQKMRDEYILLNRYYIQKSSSKINDLGTSEEVLHIVSAK